MVPKKLDLYSHFSCLSIGQTRAQEAEICSLVRDIDLLDMGAESRRDLKLQRTEQMSEVRSEVDSLARRVQNMQTVTTNMDEAQVSITRFFSLNILRWYKFFKFCGAIKI